MKKKIVKNSRKVGGNIGAIISPILSETSESMVNIASNSTVVASKTSRVVSDSDMHVQSQPGTLASELNDVRDSGSSTAINGKASSQLITISCLFCFKSTSQRIQPVVEADEVKEKRKMQLKNLCDQLNLNKHELPASCLKENFPFCDGCEKNVEKLWNHKEEIKQLQMRMATLQTEMLATIEEIQITVKEMDFFEKKMKKPENPLVAEAEAKKFTKLRVMILEAYREALWTAKFSQQHDSLSVVNATECGVGVAKSNFDKTATKENVLEGGSRIIAVDKINEISSQALMSAPRADVRIRPHPTSTNRLPATKASSPSSVPAATQSTSKNGNTTKMRSAQKGNLPSTSNQGANGNLKRKRTEVPYGLPSIMPSVFLIPIDGEAPKNDKKGPVNQKTDENPAFLNKKQKFSQLSDRSDPAAPFRKKAGRAAQPKLRKVFCVCKQGFPTVSGLQLHLKSCNVKSTLPSPTPSEVQVVTVKRIRKKTFKYGNPPVQQKQPTTNSEMLPIIKMEQNEETEDKKEEEEDTEN